jgi:hypothetical protein
LLSLLLSVVSTSQAAAATIEWDGSTFETVNVKAAIVSLRGEQVLKLERDVQSFPFDPTREVETVEHGPLRGVEPPAEQLGHDHGKVKPPFLERLVDERRPSPREPCDPARRAPGRRGRGTPVLRRRRRRGA